MDFKKIMCDRLGYKYKDVFGHLEFILNKMNNLLNNYGCGLSDDELKMLNDLFLKLETGQIEIIKFTRPVDKLQSNWDSLRELLINEKKLIEEDEFFSNLSNKDYIGFILDKMNELERGDE